jgi:UDP-N-acetyl-D-glucosamine/UDP-N-acetyl-D-galactosamine dehydrogenase
VAHQPFVTTSIADYANKIRAGGCFIDVKSQFDVNALKAADLTVWRL